MNVTHVVSGGDIAGGQLVALQLARAAREQGYGVSFVAPSAGPFVELVRAEGMHVDVVPIRSALDVVAVARLTRVFRRTGADVVHTHAHFSISVAARVAGRLARGRVLAHVHIENVFRAGPGRSAQIALDNATARLCFAIVAVSDATHRSLLAQGYPGDRTVTIHNGVDLGEPVAPVRLAAGPTVLTVGRLAEVKGQHVLLGALARIAATAVVVGRDIEHAGAQERSLSELAEQLGVAERVVFAGYRDDVPALLAGCDVFCLPSLAEGLPLAILEAMARGKPVVASAVGGTPELVVDGVTGLLVPPGDVDALAGALNMLLLDPELARRLGDAGRERAHASFSLAGMVERVLGLYGSRA